MVKYYDLDKKNIYLEMFDITQYLIIKSIKIIHIFRIETFDWNFILGEPVMIYEIVLFLVNYLLTKTRNNFIL